MSTKLVAVAAIALATVALSAVAAAGPAAKRQRVAITAANGNTDAFVLNPLASGPIQRDSGTATACCWSRRFVTRDGQRIEINDPIQTLVGKHGTLVIRIRIEWVDAGNSYTIGTGTWRVVHGTGAYKNVKGSGRQAGLWNGDTVLSFREEGYLRRS